MYFVHFCLSTVFQNVVIPFTSSSFVFGLATRWMYSFSSCQRFSRGFKSGHSAGVFHQLMLFSLIHFCACFEVCLGSLSCINLWPSGQASRMKGSSVTSRMLVYSSFFIMPSKLQMPHPPLRLMPAQTCTLVGSLVPRLLGRGEKRAWYLLFAHAHNYPLLNTCSGKSGWTKIKAIDRTVPCELLLLSGNNLDWDTNANTRDSPPMFNFTLNFATCVKTVCINSP